MVEDKARSPSRPPFLIARVVYIAGYSLLAAEPRRADEFAIAQKCRDLHVRKRRAQRLSPCDRKLDVFCYRLG
jgi:hypothetical protein